MIDWPHAPPHRFDATGIFFITASTYLKHQYYRSRLRLDRMRDRLFALAKLNDCWLEAWCLLSNHYHLVVRAEGLKLRDMISRLHSEEGLAVNHDERVSGRQIWYQCRDTQLTFEKSWLARLRYTHENAVHHGLVKLATNYPWCSASWFANIASPAFAKTVASFKIDRVNVRDDFEVEPVED